MLTILRGRKREVRIAHDLPVVIIGERINPTGKKWLTTNLLQGRLKGLERLAAMQVENGASVIDINVGAVGVKETDLLPRAVEQVLQEVDVPICIETADTHALEAALAMHKRMVPRGKALVNSVTGEETRRKEVLPLVKAYGAAVIGLCMDDEGIPASPEGRLAVGEQILEDAESLGIAREDVILDCLALGLGLDQKAGLVALEAVRKARKTFGVNLTLGVSNISYGLPERGLLNNTFLILAIMAGVSCPIVDPKAAGPATVAADLLLGRDPFAKRYIQEFRRR